MSPLLGINSASRIQSALIDRDGGRYTRYLLRSGGQEKVERKAVMAVRSDV